MMARFLIALAAAATLAAGPAWAGATKAGDAAAGKGLYKAKCAMCHGDTAQAPNGIGPRLFGVVGRKAGKLAGYTYSPAMAASGLVWNPDQLKLYLANPQGVVRGNKMPMAPLAAAADRDNIVAYLATLR